MAYNEYTFYGPQASVEAAVSGYVNVIGPMRVDSTLGLFLGLSLGGLNLILTLGTPKYFARVRCMDTMPAPPSGCTMIAEADAQKTVGVFA